MGLRAVWWGCRPAPSGRAARPLLHLTLPQTWQGSQASQECTAGLTSGEGEQGACQQQSGSHASLLNNMSQGSGSGGCAWSPQVPCAGVAEELLWFIKGSTDARELQAKKIHIWDGNSSKEYLTSIGQGHRCAPAHLQCPCWC